MSGRGANYGQWISAGAKVGVQEVNSNGGVMGHPLKEQLEDTASDPVDAVPAWHKLATVNPAFELGPSSKEIQGVIKLYDPAKILTFMVGGTTAVDHMNYKYVYRVTPSDTTLTAAMAYYAVQKGYKRAVMFFEATADATEELDNTTKFFTAHGGTVADTESLALHQASYRSEVAKAFATNPDVVFAQGDPQTAATLFSNIKEQGHLNIPIISDDNGATADFAKTMGLDNASKWLVGVTGARPAGQSWQHYTDIYKTVMGTNSPFEQSSNSYDAVIIAALAMTAAKSTDAKVWVDKIIQVANSPGTQCYTYKDCVALLDQGKKINYEGATGPEDFNQYHNVFGDWDIAQITADGSNFSVVMHVPATAIDQYINGK
jgi:ABC-type branched-subunit amino acid transport system substrate-binding protein